jgi:hypothetical protein
MNIGAHFRLQTKYWCMWHTLRFQVGKVPKLTDAKKIFRSEAEQGQGM